MTEQQRRYLIALAAEVASNPDLAEQIPAETFRDIWLAIDADMGRRSDPKILVDQFLADLGIPWIPEPPAIDWEA